MICFQADGGGQGTHPMSTFAPLPSIQASTHARVVYFGVAYSDLSQFSWLKLHEVHILKNPVKDCGEKIWVGREL